MSIAPEELLNKVIERYSSCAGYEDIGTAKNRRVTTEQFRTTFKRTDSLQLHFSDSNRWSDEKRTTFLPRAERGISTLSYREGQICIKRFCSVEQEAGSVEDFETLIGRGIFFAVDLLIPSAIGSLGIRDIKGLAVKDSSILDGTQCVVLSGTLRQPKDIEIWIDPLSMSLKRVRTKEWFRELSERELGADLPCLDSMPFDSDCRYENVVLL